MTCADFYRFFINQTKQQKVCRFIVPLHSNEVTVANIIAITMTYKCIAIWQQFGTSNPVEWFHHRLLSSSLRMCLNQAITLLYPLNQSRVWTSYDCYVGNLAHTYFISITSEYTRSVLAFSRVLNHFFFAKSWNVLYLHLNILFPHFKTTNWFLYTFVAI